MLKQVSIVLIETSHPGNIGAAARAMMNMGLEKLVLVRPHKFPSATATARASGAVKVLAEARVCDTLDEALQDTRLVLGASARSRSIAWPECDPENASQKISAVNGEAAILFGREHSGLNNEELDRCHQLLKIPTNPTFSSLNVASAVQVMAYEMRCLWLKMQQNEANEAEQNGQVAQSEQHIPASSELMDGFYQHLEQTLIDVDYLDPEKPRRLMRRLHRLFNRAAPSDTEINILRGILTAAQKQSK
ncbi:RNA methyltransferase [Candidatus Venteria ishoeyi]|uniref:tRNA (cytidine/uridine-2'-O-)-methyltransferase TrmJ n=1 Tax=Candidatus Venteria ishoeyi TaxID=1899563 RepID=A0A1H6F995_9GAMM|nr:RNA methyltransferase [Candidatus Venteria ishoeyi]MDM8545159.1 RNA methyltransferase [Candidatus Venteria ishoeyi]SEH06677.1 tRNA (cytidine/uridine-2'-O-)-methyltransferase TrmJ [Candidatus Venteria ishoeyi]